MGNEQFARLHSEKKEREILGPLPESVLPTKKARVPSGLSTFLANLYEVPLLTREQEVHLFKKMNYLKYKASRLREALDTRRPKSRLMDQIERLYDESIATRIRSSRPTCGWWFRLPSDTSVRRRTFSSSSATGMCR